MRPRCHRAAVLGDWADESMGARGDGRGGWGELRGGEFSYGDYDSDERPERGALERILYVSRA